MSAITKSDLVRNAENSRVEFIVSFSHVAGVWVGGYFSSGTRQEFRAARIVQLLANSQTIQPQRHFVRKGTSIIVAALGSGIEFG